MQLPQVHSPPSITSALAYRRKKACNLNLKLFDVWAMPRKLNAFRHRSGFTFSHAAQDLASAVNGVTQVKNKLSSVSTANQTFS
jgi:hypothetical protein